MKSYVEKDGSFVNFQNKVQTFKRVTTVVSEALTLSEAALLLAGRSPVIRPEPTLMVETQRRSDQVMQENRKKNEFVFKRGTL
jgi:NADH-quinone oxidoreductase subunit G